ncbi:hypothetical protein B0H14DRAFT_2581150 [Mycena olivaceomarginata]|nr:hypothetical protein B0H14DRAFT_2581150 [Mycena olivaceomarginata]
MASVIWVDSDGDDDLFEFDHPLSVTVASYSGGQRASALPHPTHEIEILETPNAKRHKATIDSSDSEDRVSNEEDHAVALALQAKWDEEDALAQRRAAKTEEKSLRLIARLQKMAEKRQRLAQRKDVPDDGIVFKVVMDADGKTLEGDDDPDNVTQLALLFFQCVLEILVRIQLQSGLNQTII